MLTAIVFTNFYDLHIIDVIEGKSPQEIADTFVNTKDVRPKTILIMKNGERCPDLIARYERGRDFFENTATIDEAINIICDSIKKSKNYTQIIELLAQVTGALDITIKGEGEKARIYWNYQNMP